MKKNLTVLLFFIMLAACVHKNNADLTEQLAASLASDYFDYYGPYFWTFNLMGGEQVSTHTFYPDSIVYSMKGKVYSVDYTMKKLSYDSYVQKWIGEEENGIVYVLFFDEKTDSTVNIYKHKCKANGLEEAISFHKPAADATADHGWNVYALDGMDKKDVLPISGNYARAADQIYISDSLCTSVQGNFEKLSFHLGERRWVGKSADQYIQIFFYSLATSDTVHLSVEWSDNLTALYNRKFNSVDDWESYKRIH